MYESDGSIMVYWHALDCPETPTGKCAIHLHVDNQMLTFWKYLHRYLHRLDYFVSCIEILDAMTYYVCHKYTLL